MLMWEKKGDGIVPSTQERSGEAVYEDVVRTVQRGIERKSNS